MADDGATTVDALLVDLVTWLRNGPKPYADVMDAWRTSCPRLPVWEEAQRRGLVAFTRLPVEGLAVAVTPLGHTFLHDRRMASTA